jgi:hypothetical protein
VPTSTVARASACQGLVMTVGRGGRTEGSVRVSRSAVPARPCP